jgi:NADP-dependent 3-hydroxy acid dehydrogenase YdfG
MWNKILDASIFWSFDLSGYLRHEKYFDETYHFPKGSHALITGGTSGIGLAATLEMLKEGVHVTITGRSTVKGEALLKSHSNLKFKKMDMAHWSEIDSFVHELEPT